MPLRARHQRVVSAGVKHVHDVGVTLHTRHQLVAVTVKHLVHTRSHTRTHERREYDTPQEHYTRMTGDGGSTSCIRGESSPRQPHTRTLHNMHSHSHTGAHPHTHRLTHTHTHTQAGTLTMGCADPVATTNRSPVGEKDTATTTWSSLGANVLNARWFLGRHTDTIHASHAHTRPQQGNGQ